MGARASTWAAAPAVGVQLADVERAVVADLERHREVAVRSLDLAAVGAAVGRLLAERVVQLHAGGLLALDPLRRRVRNLRLVAAAAAGVRLVVVGEVAV